MNGKKYHVEARAVASFEKIMHFKQRAEALPAKMNKGKIIVRFKCTEERENESNPFLSFSFVFLGVENKNNKDGAGWK